MLSRIENEDVLGDKAQAIASGEDACSGEIVLDASVCNDDSLPSDLSISSIDIAHDSVGGWINLVDV